jgi:hypothetical protein
MLFQVFCRILKKNGRLRKQGKYIIEALWDGCGRSALRGEQGQTGVNTSALMNEEERGGER